MLLSGIHITESSYASQSFKNQCYMQGCYHEKQAQSEISGPTLMKLIGIPYIVPN